MGRKRPHPSSSQKMPNPWDDIEIKNGELSGMLTDVLANSALPSHGDVSRSKRNLEPRIINEPKVNKTLPNKFKK